MTKIYFLLVSFTLKTGVLYLMDFVPPAPMGVEQNPLLL